MDFFLLATYRSQSWRMSESLGNQQTRFYHKEEYTFVYLSLENDESLSR